MMDLLPAPDEAPRCSEWARAHEYDPGGTAIDVDLLVLVDVLLPWPKPVFAHDSLTGIDGVFDTRQGRARILATVPDNSRTRLRVLSYWRDGAKTRSAGHSYESPDELTDLIDQIRRDGHRSGDHLDDNVVAPVDALLVCSQGSHDVCCGTRGTRLALEAGDAFPDTNILRVSHTGGHRFAPTAMTLPDGRMWAYLDVNALDRIRNRRGVPADVASRCRGWWGAEAGPAQVAERAVFERSGWEWEDTVRSVSLIDDDGDRRTWLVEADGQEWDVTVAPARVVPTIACGAPGGLPTKPSTEYRVERVRVR